MAKDQTESIRRLMVAALNSEPVPTREELEELGQVWDTQELQQDFTVHSFLAPYVEVTRKSDNKKGSLMFQHLPRFYFGWEEDGK